MGELFLNRKDFFSWIAFFKWAKLAKFIRYETLWELLFKQTFFYHKVLGEQVKGWRFWGHWGTSEMFCEALYNLGFLRNDKVASWTSFADLQSVLSHQLKLWGDGEMRWWRLWRMKDEGWRMRCKMWDTRCEIGKPEDGLWVTKLWKWCGMLR